MSVDIDFNQDFGEHRQNEISNWNKLCMNFCLNAAKLSKCAAKQVSSIIADENSIYSLGVNGTFPGQINCEDLFKKVDDEWYIKKNGEWVLSEDKEIHHKWSLLNEVHAEVNALSKMNKKGISTNGLDIYCNYSPCFNCAKSIITAGIKNVYFHEFYDGYEKVMELLNENGVNFYHIDSADLYDLEEDNTWIK